MHLYYVTYLFYLFIRAQGINISDDKNSDVSHRCHEWNSSHVCEARPRSLGQCGWPQISGGTVAPFGQFRSVHLLSFYSLDKLRVWCRQAWWRKALKINFTSWARKLPPFLSSVGCSQFSFVWCITEKNNCKRKKGKKVLDSETDTVYLVSKRTPEKKI